MQKETSSLPQSQKIEAFQNSCSNKQWTCSKSNELARELIAAKRKDARGFVAFRGSPEHVDKFSFFEIANHYETVRETP